MDSIFLAGTIGIIYLAVVIYVLVLVTRLVKAVGRIADKITQ